MARYGTVEMGGTRTSCAVGTSPDDLSRSIRFSTTHPAETLGKVVEFLAAESPDSVGIAAFGPLDLERGRVGVTPKVGWSGVDLLAPIREALNAPIGLDTDVNGAALGESRWGAGRGLTTFVYVTVGTGIGGGALVDGHPLHGLGHPEMGHIAVRRHPEDNYVGICPLHVDCLEGLASGPAIEHRSGIPGQDLSGTALVAAVELESFYLSQLIRTLVYILAPERVILGGGVSRLPGLVDLVNSRLIEELSGYPGFPEHESGFVTPPGLGEMSGLAGGMVLAERAASRATSSE
ncbi:MAG TPA: ROK family protein [Acidimicrobiia bacterium]|nr:ROK family protein [Acidimicrobiia bacterium]